MKARAVVAQQHPSVLGTCLMAWSRGADDIDAQAGAQVAAEVLLLIRGAFTKR